jgi:hypothetical protein
MNGVKAMTKAQKAMFLRLRDAIAKIDDEATRNRATLLLNHHIAHMKTANQGIRTTFGVRPYLKMSDR